MQLFTSLWGWLKTQVPAYPLDLARKLPDDPMSILRFTRFAALLTLCGAVLFLWGCDSAGNSQENQSPSADVAVSPSTVDIGSQVTLDGSGSSDPDGDNLNYSWSLNGPSESSASLSDPSAETTPFTPDVAGDYTATLEPGVDIRFENDVALWVNSGSALVAEGTSSDPITMTATDGNEQQGWWRGLAIYSNNANNTLNYVEVHHAGSTDMSSINQATNVAVESDAILNLTNSTITDSGGNGVYCDASDASLNASGNSFSNNTG